MNQLTNQDANKWFVCPQMNADAETRLFLFPYAGGGPGVFRKWAFELPGYVEAWVGHYPGRGSRHQEAPINRMTALAESLSAAMKPLLDRPFAFFGHSFGGLVAFELVRQLRRQNYPQPQILFVSACGAPHLANPHSAIHGLTDDEFLKSLIQLNGIPPELSNRRDVMQLLLPMLRADFEAFETYAYPFGEARLDIPVVAFGAQSDARISRERIEGWRLQTNSSFKSHYFPGDHFFINSAKEPVIAFIAAEMMSSYEKG